MIKKLRGPGGILLELDPSEVFLDNPGEGTPAMVYLGDWSATYHCAVDTGEVEYEKLTDAQLDWLDKQSGWVADLYSPTW